MTKENRTATKPSEKSAALSRRSAVLSALSLLSASMGISLTGGANAEVTVNKAKTADKAFNAMDGYVRGRTVQPTKPNPAQQNNSHGGSRGRK
jgi:hypothetical protein